MELLFEFIFEVIFECSLELITSKNVRLPVRILAAILFTLIFGGIIIVFLLIAVSIIKEGNFTGGLILLFFDIFLFAMGIWGIVKKYKEHNQM